MAFREAQAHAQMQAAPGRIGQLRGNEHDVPFSDDDYDDIFMGLQEQEHAQDMDMS